MNNEDVFYAMLYCGDWSGNDFNKTLVNYLRLETQYQLSEVEEYVNAVREFELDELEWLCSESNTVNENKNVEIREYVEKNTGLSMLQILMLINAEERFYNLISDSYERVTNLLAA